jgi:hypothetical protein
MFTAPCPAPFNRFPGWNFSECVRGLEVFEAIQVGYR